MKPSLTRRRPSAEVFIFLVCISFGIPDDVLNYLTYILSAYYAYSGYGMYIKLKATCHHCGFYNEWENANILDGSSEKGKFCKRVSDIDLDWLCAVKMNGLGELRTNI